MTENDGDEVRFYQVTAVEALAAQLALRAAAAAGIALKERGFPEPTAEQAQRISEILRRTATAAAALVLAAAFAPGEPAVATDQQLDELAERLGLAALVEVLN